tara:strand:+ start:2149 stop:2979 length:831 start_codon:yes stop_codon:yes gene_type:complete
MVVVQLTNGFGNNLFQFIAARQLAEHHKKDLFLMTNANYYAIKDLKKLGISGFITHRPPKKFKMVNDNNYLDFFSPSFENDNLFLCGYFENHIYYGTKINEIKKWFPKINKRSDNDLVIHFRGTDRLLYNSAFNYKANPQSFLKATKNFNFNKLHIVTDMPNWRHITVQELKKMSLHVGVPANLRVSPQQSVDYFNSFVDTLAPLNPIIKERSIVEDFNFIRTFDNILFEHGTLGWWAAALSNASKIGVYGPWRAWKGSSNKNLSNVELPGWFKWE